MVLGLLTLVVNYIVGITSSMTAPHIEEEGDPVSMLSLPGVRFTVVILAVYSVAVSVIAAFFLRKERLEIPKLPADLHDARKFGALDSPPAKLPTAPLSSTSCAPRETARSRQFTHGDFDRRFTLEESFGQPGFRQQLRHLRSDSRHRERTGYLHRRMFLNFRMSTGKWLLLLALVTAVSVYGAIVEVLSRNDGEPDQSLLLAWGVAFVVGVVAMAGQYRCDLGKVLLTARKEFISNATEAQCHAILDQARDAVAAASQPPQSCDRSSHADHWHRCC